MTTALHLCAGEDAVRLAPMLARFAEEMALSQDDAAREAAVAPLLDGAPYGMVWLLGLRNAPIGYVVVTMGWSLARGGLEARLDEIWIRPSVRRRGIATEALVGICTRLGEADVRAAHLDVAAADVSAQRLFRRAGFVPREGIETLLRTL